VTKTDINKCCRHAAYDVTKESIQNSRVMSANMTHVTTVSVVNRKQLSTSNIIDPLFLWYLQVGSVKAKPQWAKYPNPCVRSCVRSKKLGFKMAHIYVAFSLVLIALLA
jgi:hypothetical protein